MDEVYVVMCSWVTCVWEIDCNQFYTSEKEAEKAAAKIRKQQPLYRVRIQKLTKKK